MSILPEGTVKLPAVGKVKKAYVIGGVAVVGVAVVIWYRNRKASGLTASNTSTSGTDSAGNVGVIDPVTGFVEGSAEDLAALNTASGGDIGSGGGGGSSGGGGDTSVPTQVTNGPPFTDNAAWAQYVTAYLTGTLDLDPGTVAEVIGKYLAGPPAQITVAERDSVLSPATAYGDTPPISGPNGYPPSINLVGSPSGTGSTPSAPTLSQGAVTATSATVTWVAVTGAASYAWTATGTSYSKSGSVTGTSVALTGLTAASSYTVAVHAVNAAGPGPTSSITVRTIGAPTAPPGSTGYDAVPIVAYTSAKPWNSTVSGIAAHYGYGGDWQTVWNDPKNASLRAKRKQPDLVRAGDILNVKKK